MIFFSFNKTTLTSVRGGLSKDKKLTLVKVFSVRVVFEVSSFQLFGQRKSNLLTFSFKIHILREVHSKRNFAWANSKWKLLFLMEIGDYWLRGAKLIMFGRNDMKRSVCLLIKTDIFVKID